MTQMTKTAALVLCIGLMGCGKKPAPVDPGSGGPATAGEPALNGCTAYKDMSTEGAYTIPWDESIATSELRCIQIKVDQTVGYAGNFTTHPIKSAGGTAPTPFDDAASALSNPGDPSEQSNFLFTAPGTYGFVCGVHPSMTGAVLVVP